MAEKFTGGAGSGVGRMQKADHQHVHSPKTHADGHGTGHKKIERMMVKPHHNPEQE